MKNILPLFIASILFIAIKDSNAQEGKKLPSVALKTLQGQTVDLQSLGEKGVPVLISFWATWCSPCKKELDAIADYYPDWQENYDLEIVAITIDSRRQLAKVGPMVETKGWEYTILSDENSNCLAALNFQSVPQTFLLNTEGEIVYSHFGYLPGDEIELEEKIAKAASK